MRLDVPDFTRTDPHSRLFPINEYFSLLNTLVDQRLRIVCLNLEGAAAEWFRWMTRNNLITDWDRFYESVTNRFGPSKSTHNFVQPEVLEKMKLPITTMKQFKVYIGSGETLLCENLCSRVKLDIQGLSMEVDLYVLSMKGSDIMLRIQWLQKLGKVTHEYLQQTMEFILGETQYTLQGDESLCIKQISLRHMPLVGSVNELRQENKTFLRQIHQKLKRNEPLLTRYEVWEDVLMDFIMGILVYKGLLVMLVVVDRFTKYAYFGTLHYGFNVTKVVEVCMDIVVKLHGIPKLIMSNRDRIIVSKFWKQLFEAIGTKLYHSTTYHPQMDGQTKVVNPGLEQYLRAMVSDRPQH
nr:transposon Ty3-G Gag-Pol polyprotein [Tanacetum cinerariifolium]